MSLITENKTFVCTLCLPTLKRAKIEMGYVHTLYVLCMPFVSTGLLLFDFTWNSWCGRVGLIISHITLSDWGEQLDLQQRARLTQPNLAPNKEDV